MKRRNFLLLASGGIVLAAGTGVGLVANRKPLSALEPWHDAGSQYTEPRMRALSYAILAPNPHNRQPWMVELIGENQVVLRVDTERMLPHTDPFNRQITIGLGCFLELMRMAAADDGFAVTTELFPDGQDGAQLDARPVAVATFEQSPEVTPDPLFAHVLDRRSHKEPYDMSQPVSSDVLDRISGVTRYSTQVEASNEASRVRRLRKLTNQALRIEIETPRTFRESVDLFRIGKTEIEANPDGIDFSGPMFETLSLFGLFSREGSLDPASSQFKQGQAAVLENTDTAMAHLWQSTPGNSRADQIDAGRDWIRLNLAATAQGVAMQPLSQALQEYSEMAPLYEELHDTLLPGGGTLQMLARLGYAPPVPESPRWPLEAKITGA